jgi:hypothetical protein
MLVFGGYDCAFQYHNDVWELSLSGPPAWMQLSPTGSAPSLRSGQSAIYDPVRDQMVVFAGVGTYQINDVWALEWGAGSCAIPEIDSYDPTVVTPENCSTGCTVSFVANTPDDYSSVTKITLERYRQGSWIPEDSLVAPLPAPAWTLTCEMDQHFTDGEHIFHVVFHCGDGSRGVSQTATVLAARGVATAIGAFGAEYSQKGVVLRWDVGSDATLRGFNIYRSLRAETGFERINGDLISAANRNEYTDGDVSRGRTYWYRLGAVDGDGEWASQIVSITVPIASVALHQNTPNPFNPTTSISYFLPDRSRARLVIYDVEGRYVKSLVDDVVDAGVREVVWNGTDAKGQSVSTGVYFYRLTVGNRSLTKKMLLLK